MANKDINGLPLKAVPAGTDEFELQETGGGASKKTTAQAIANLAPSSTQQYELILRVSPSGTGVVSFTGLNLLTQYRHLEFRGVCRTTAAVGSAQVQATINSDGAANYNNQRVQGANNAATGPTNAALNYLYFADAPGTSATANVPAQFRHEILDFLQTVFDKVATGNMGAQLIGTTQIFATVLYAVWLNTAAISRVDLTLSTGNYVSPGSTIELWGRR